jgi:hypothetical protein
VHKCDTFATHASQLVLQSEKLLCGVIIGHLFSLVHHGLGKFRHLVIPTELAVESRVTSFLFNVAKSVQLRHREGKQMLAFAVIALILHQSTDESMGNQV